jgi:hypothetical protein
MQGPRSTVVSFATLAGLGPVLAVAVTGGGCVADGGDESMLVLKNVMPKDKCMFAPGENETGITAGAIDVQIGTGYLFTAQIKSRVTAVTGQEDQRTILLSGANVDVTFPDATLFTSDELAKLRDSAVTHFKSLFTSPLTPNGGVLDAQFELLPFELVTAVAAKGKDAVVVLANFKVTGAFPGGDGELTSQAFSYPITILKQGLVNNKGPCGTVSSSFVPRVGNSCNPGQDFVVDCCTSAAGLECPAVGTATM